ncbi:DDB1- and CUL4-associated factor 10, partial [Armadillidium nasatum]
WTCVHDIQELDPAKSEDKPLVVNTRPISMNENESMNCPLGISVNPRVEIMLRQNFIIDRQEESDITLRDTESEQVSENSNIGQQVGFNPIDVVQVIENYDRMRRGLHIPSNNHNIEAESQEDNHSIITSTSLNLHVNENSTSSRNQDFRLRQRQRRIEGSLDRREDFRNIFVVRPDIPSNRTLLLLNCYNRLPGNIRERNKLNKNVSRLTNFIEEPNKGKGFIKELCFSSDGRLICSPFDCGIRLMMFDDKCSELSHCIQKEPQQLRVISSNICHTNCVVSTKFSPVDCLLVSGCLNGKIHCLHTSEVTIDIRLMFRSWLRVLVSSFGCEFGLPVLTHSF